MVVHLRPRAEAPIQRPRKTSVSPTPGLSALEAITLEYELTPEEWVAAMGLHHDATHVRRGDVRRLQAITGGLLGAVAVGAWIMGFWVTAGIWATISLAYVHSIPGQLKRQARLHLGRTAGEGVIAGLFGTHRIELRAEGIADITSGYETVFRWNAVEGVDHEEGLFIIHVGPHAFIPIPDSAFGGPEELRAFSDAFYTLRGLDAEKTLRRRTTVPGNPRP